MKITTLATSVLLSGLAAADDIQSKPFKLILDSADGSINGKSISSCHSGAAIEALCIGGSTNDAYQTYYLNTTEGSTSPVEGYGPSGKLVWNIPLQGTTESEAMQFFYEPYTNIAHPLFEPSYVATYVAFGDKDNELAIFSYIDDTVSPPKTGEFKALKQWYACITDFSGYRYQSLNWVVGNGKPQNPSCIKTEVKRVFI